MGNESCYVGQNEMAGLKGNLNAFKHEAGYSEAARGRRSRPNNWMACGKFFFGASQPTKMFNPYF